MSELPLDQDLLGETLSLAAQAFYLVDRDGNVHPCSFAENDSVAKTVEEGLKRDGQKIMASNSAYSVRIDEETNCLILISKAQGNGYAVVSVSLPEFVRSIDNTATFTGYGICLVGEQSEPICLTQNQPNDIWKRQIFSLDDHHPYDRILNKMRKGQEGVGKLSKTDFEQSETDAASGEILIGYSPLSFSSQRWSIAVVSDDSKISAAVSSHAQGIMVAMVCLFLVLLIVCVAYYKSEKSRLLLGQQSELGQTTKELHHVTMEKRQISDQLQGQIDTFRQLLDTLPFAIYWKDGNGRLKDSNAAFKSLTASVLNDEIDHEVLTKGIELLNVPEEIDLNQPRQRYWVSRIPIRSGKGMLGFYVPETLFKNLLSDRPETQPENHSLTEAFSMIEFELFRYRSEINEQEQKIQKYESCLPERLEHLFRDKVKRAEEILSMKDEDPMSTIQTRQLMESVQKSLSCFQQQTSSANIEFEISDQLPPQINSEWHKLYQSLTILGETVASVNPGPVRFCADNRSDLSWIDQNEEIDGGIVFSVQWKGTQLPQKHLSQILDVEVPLIEWYHQCSDRSQAVSFRVAARLLSKIDYRLKASSDGDTCRFWFMVPVENQEDSQETLTDCKIDDGQKRDVRQAENQSTLVEPDIPHILIVDDVQENCTLMQIILAKDGHRSTVCESGEKAVGLCSQQRFDLILMDIQMPGMNGLDATKQIRAGEMNTSTPIIAMTASEQSEDELAALDAGCDDYLAKPIKRKLMERKIWRSLEKTRQIKDAEAGKDIISFLDGNGDYQKAIETFIENLPQRIDEMKQAFDQHDMKDLSFKVHALKGLGGFAGFSVYTEKARQMEESIKRDDIDKVYKQLDEMIKMCLRTRLKSDC
ncbi:MAG: response regulator [Planctomycetota bacterium]